MQYDIAVRVSDNATGMWNAHTAEHDEITWAKGVNVNTGSNSHEKRS